MEEVKEKARPCRVYSCFSDVRVLSLHWVLDAGNGEICSLGLIGRNLLVASFWFANQQRLVLLFPKACEILDWRLRG